MAAAKTYRPEELATELGVSGKLIRAYLRRNHSRDAKAKNTAWVVPESVAKDVRKAFAKNQASEKPKDNA
jgi:hypothetical protein